MNLSISFLLLISFALIQALPTPEQIDETFLFIGSHGEIGFKIKLMIKC